MTLLRHFLLAALAFTTLLHGEPGQQPPAIVLPDTLATTATGHTIDGKPWTHPVFRLALGLAWGGPIPVPAGTTCTIEAREVAPDGMDLAVVGRCEFVAGQPAAIPSNLLVEEKHLGGTATNIRLQLSFDPNPNVPGTTPTERYAIYRGDSGPQSGM